MGNGMIHCINCGATTAESGGKARCSACGAGFEFTRVEVKESGAVPLDGTPAESGEKAKGRLDRYCVAAGILSLVSCAFPLIALTAIGLAIVGLRRVRRTGARGGKHAVEAIALSIIGIGAFSIVAPRMYAARAQAMDSTCKANLASLGQRIMLYENEHRWPRGYTLEDVARFGGTELKTERLSCPDVEPASGGKPIPAYVILSSLQPFGGLRDPAKTVIAFGMHTHHVPASEGFPEATHVNALFADGHVEGLPVEKAAGVIERSLLAERRGAATRPER